MTVSTTGHDQCPGQVPEVGIIGSTPVEKVLVDGAQRSLGQGLVEEDRPTEAGRGIEDDEAEPVSLTEFGQQPLPSHQMDHLYRLPLEVGCR